VESESARMAALVDDLLLLARLDAGRPLAHDPVDLSRLAIDAISDARAAGPDHRWSLDLPEDPVVVPGDEHRLHQVLANLLTNARTHTPAGSEVTVAVAVRREADGQWRDRRADRQRHRPRDPGRAATADLRAVHPRRLRAVAGGGQYRPGAGHRGGGH